MSTGIFGKKKQTGFLSVCTHNYELCTTGESAVDIQFENQ